MPDPTHSLMLSSDASIMVPGLPFLRRASAANFVLTALAPERVRIDCDACSVKAVFEEAGRLFAADGGLSSQQVAQSLSERENLASTALGLGVALPHARIKGLKRPLAAFIRLAHPIHFDAPDGQPVQDIFVLLVPERATELHLQMLAEIAEKFSDPAFRARLHRQANASVVHGILESGLPRLGQTG